MEDAYWADWSHVHMRSLRCLKGSKPDGKTEEVADDQSFRALLAARTANTTPIEKFGTLSNPGTLVSRFVATEKDETTGSPGRYL